MIAIHFRTPKSLELSISAGRHVRYFVAFRWRGEWAVEEFDAGGVVTLAKTTRRSMFRFFRYVENSLLTFQKSEFKDGL